MKRDETCNICKKANSMISKCTRCSYEFCIDCIYKWLLSKYPICPNCEKKFKPFVIKYYLIEGDKFILNQEIKDLEITYEIYDLLCEDTTRASKKYIQYLDDNASDKNKLAAINNYTFLSIERENIFQKLMRDAEYVEKKQLDYKNINADQLYERYINIHKMQNDTNYEYKQRRK
jgi:hypothetical protein